MVTHDLEVAATTDRTVVMQDGRVVDDGRAVAGSAPADGHGEHLSRARIS